MKYKISREDFFFDLSVTILCVILIVCVVIAPLLKEVGYIEGVFAGAALAVIVLFTIFNWNYDLKEAEE